MVKDLWLHVLYIGVSGAQMKTFRDGLIIDEKILSPIERAMAWRIIYGFVNVVVEKDGNIMLYPSRTKRMNMYEYADVERDIRHFWVERNLRLQMNGAHCFVEVTRRPISRKRLRKENLEIK